MSANKRIVKKRAVKYLLIEDVFDGKKHVGILVATFLNQTYANFCCDFLNRQNTNGWIKFVVLKKY